MLIFQKPFILLAVFTLILSTEAVAASGTTTNIPVWMLIIAPIITGVGSCVAAVGSIVNGWRLTRTNKELKSVRKTGEATHTLSNSAMGEQIKTKLETFRAMSVIAHRLALVTGTEGDHASAEALDVQVELVAKELSEHVARQAAVDARIATEREHC
jgi:hypothetical protein